MAQRPTAIPIVFPLPDDILRDTVSREVLGGDFANLEVNHQTDLNSLAEDAFFEISNIVKWYAASDSNYADPGASDAPAELNELFKITWLAKAFRRFRSLDDGAAFQKQHVEPAMLRALTSLEANFDTDTGSGDVMNLRSLRRHVISVMVRQRTPTIPPFEVVGQIIRDEFVKLWNHARWRWRVRHVKATLTEFIAATNTGGDIILPDETNLLDEMDTLASKRIYIKTSTGARVPIQWLDETRTAEAAIRYDGKRGTPRYFYDEDRGQEEPIAFHWFPNPDQDFMIFFAMVLRAPAFVDADSANGFSSLPVEFRASLRDYVTAKVLHLWGREDNDAARVFAVAKAERRELAAAWVDPGASRYTARGHHGLRFHKGLASYPYTGLSGQLD